jgi:cob(I)alamin adenosyltransferase
MSIVTKRGDEGQTDLAGRVRISKGSLRVECYGTVDELVAQLGLARAMLPDTEVGDEVRAIQKVLFRICASLATVDASSVERPSIDPSLIDTLDQLVSRLESAMVEKPDWSITSEQPGTAALDVARTVCRRAERHAVRLTDSGKMWIRTHWSI